VFLVAWLASPGAALAGRDYYGWLYGTEVLPERGAELMTWVSEQNAQRGDGPTSSETRWWVAPLIGITDQLELALPVEVAWDRVDGAMPAARTVFDRYGGELRYRFVTQDPVDAPPLVPLVRVALKRSVVDRDMWIPEADFVVSYEQGIVHVLADLGGYAELRTCSGRYDTPSCDHTHFELHPGVGVSVLAVDQLRFGAEAHAELALDHGGSWAIVGPNMAWSHGRSWLSAVYGIGVYNIKDAPKVQWGIAF
jgi:hypothetical protein